MVSCKSNSNKSLKKTPLFKCLCLLPNHFIVAVAVSLQDADFESLNLLFGGYSYLMGVFPMQNSGPTSFRKYKDGKCSSPRAGEWE